MANPRELLARCDVQVDAHEYQAAAESLEDLAFGETDAVAVAAARKLALVRCIQGKYGDEIRAVRRAAELTAGSPEGTSDRIRLAEVLVRSGRFAEGLRILKECEAAASSGAHLLHLVSGMASARLGDWCSAVKHYEAAMTSATPGSIESFTARICLGQALCKTGSARAAEDILTKARRGLRGLVVGEARACLARGHVLLLLADVWMEVGDLDAARRACQDAKVEADRLGSPALIRWYYSRVSSLAWLLGNVREAVRLELHPEHLRALAEIGEPRLRFYPFANAAMFAIELGELEKAEGYIARAEASAQGVVTKREPAYLLLLHGALRVARGDFESAERYLDLAEKAFMAMTEGGYRRGIYEVLLQRGELCRARRDVAGALRVAMRVVEKPEREGSIDLQSRALLLRSFLLVDESKGLDDVYEDVIQRMLVINSPAVKFKILTNLYFYCQKFCCYDTESFHWQRLQNMRSVLDESVYQDLYHEYVVKRYAKKIADLFAGPRPGDGGPSETEPDLPDPRDLDAMF